MIKCSCHTTILDTLKVGDVVRLLKVGDVIRLFDCDITTDEVVEVNIADEYIKTKSGLMFAKDGRLINEETKSLVGTINILGVEPKQQQNELYTRQR